MAFSYTVHGLRITSELQLPEVTPGPSSGQAHVAIRVQTLPPLDDLQPTAIDNLQVSGAHALFSFDGAGRFLVRNGNEILVDPDPDADLALVRLFLLGSCMGIICQQRGLLTLHASAVAYGNNVIAFTGLPGAGKSTLAAHCIAAGATLVSDDVLVVGCVGGRALAQPGASNLKLWRDALTNLGRDAGSLRADWFRSEKFHLPTQQVETALPFTRLYVLESDDTAGSGAFRQLSGAAATSAIITNSYRVEYLDLIGRRDVHFLLSAELTKSIEVIELRRSRSHQQLRETASIVMAELDCMETA